MQHDCDYKCSWFKHILFITEHYKGLGRAKKLCSYICRLSHNNTKYTPFGISHNSGGRDTIVPMSHESFLPVCLLSK